MDRLKPKRQTKGVLLFDLNDSTTAAIPGEWVGDTLMLRNDQEVALAPLDAHPGLWSIPIFDGTLSLINDAGHWHDVLRPREYRVAARWERRRPAKPRMEGGHPVLGLDFQRG